METYPFRQINISSKISEINQTEIKRIPNLSHYANDNSDSYCNPEMIKKSDFSKVISKNNLNFHKEMFPLKQVRFELNKSNTYEYISKLNKIKKRFAQSELSKKRSNASFFRHNLTKPKRLYQEVGRIEKINEKQENQKATIKTFNFENLCLEIVNNNRIKLESRKRNVPVNFMRNAHRFQPTINELYPDETFNFEGRTITANIFQGNPNNKVNRTFLIKKKDNDETCEKGHRNKFYSSFNMSKLDKSSQNCLNQKKDYAISDFSRNFEILKSKAYSNVIYSRNLENTESNDN